MVMTAHHIGSYRATSNATGRDTKERHERDTSRTGNQRLLDQADLHGLLQKIRDVGLPLVSVTPADRGGADHATIDPY
jgi:hypothetical protein